MTGDVYLPAAVVANCSRSNAVRVHQLAIDCSTASAGRSPAVRKQDAGVAMLGALVEADEVDGCASACGAVIREARAAGNDDNSCVDGTDFQKLLRRFLEERPVGLPPCYRTRMELRLAPGEPSPHLPLRRMNPKDSARSAGSSRATRGRYGHQRGRSPRRYC